MAKPLVLTPSEKLLFDELSDGVSSLRESGYKDPAEALIELAPKARELHMSLKIHGHEPAYHGFILKNRGVPAEELSFFEHIHPIEDLLSFIKNPEDNDEQDILSPKTRFSFPLYVGSKRRYIDYRLICTQTCWMVYINDDKQGELPHVLSSENISYPVTAAEMLEEIRKAAVSGATKQEIQNALGEIADWISTSEKSMPNIRKDIEKGLYNV